MKIKKAKITRTEGDDIKTFEQEYYEFPAEKINNMLKRVENGEDELMLREKMIRGEI